MKRIVTTILLCAAVSVWFAGCSDDTPETKAELSITPATISASAAAGEYTLALTGNVDWTATANAEWLTLEPASGNGNATITVTVADNARVEARTATLSFTAGELNNTAIVTQEAKPFYAISDKTWIVGNQIWSDVIQVPECNKTTYANQATEPDCRKYTDSRGTMYLYNWTYVNQNSKTICPDPWRVPSETDFMNLDIALGGNGANRVGIDQTWIDDQYITFWGGEYGGGINGNADMVNRTFFAYYWSSKGSSSLIARCLSISTDGNGLVYPMANLQRENGFPVRCVKDN
jgi:uncharacterized protein (TIGR02145 family)